MTELPNIFTKSWDKLKYLIFDSKGMVRFNVWLLSLLLGKPKWDFSFALCPFVCLSIWPIRFQHFCHHLSSAVLVCLVETILDIFYSETYKSIPIKLELNVCDLFSVSSKECPLLLKKEQWGVMQFKNF